MDGGKEQLILPEEVGNSLYLCHPGRVSRHLSIKEEREVDSADV